MQFSGAAPMHDGSRHVSVADNPVRAFNTDYTNLSGMWIHVNITVILTCIAGGDEASVSLICTDIDMARASLEFGAGQEPIAQYQNLSIDVPPGYVYAAETALVGTALVSLYEWIEVK